MALITSPDESDAAVAMAADLISVFAAQAAPGARAIEALLFATAERILAGSSNEIETQDAAFIAADYLTGIVRARLTAERKAKQ